MFVFRLYVLLFFFFKQKTSYEMRISDWSSDVCSSELQVADALGALAADRHHGVVHVFRHDVVGRQRPVAGAAVLRLAMPQDTAVDGLDRHVAGVVVGERRIRVDLVVHFRGQIEDLTVAGDFWLQFGEAELAAPDAGRRSEEHTSELPSLMRISYSVFCL